MNKLAAAAVASSLLILGACSSDDDDASSVANSAGTYTVTFTNLSVGQPMTPPVVAIHDNAVNLFQTGTAASTQLQEIAENGNNDPMVELAGSLGDQVSAAGVAVPDPANPGPLPPGESSTISLTTTASNHVLSAVNMVVCTNDGFTGLDSVELPAGSRIFMAMPYDAGTELNTNTINDFVPPCGGDGSNGHTDEAGVVAAHPGQTGTGNFDFTGGQDILQVVVTRQQ